MRQERDDAAAMRAKVRRLRAVDLGLAPPGRPHISPPFSEALSRAYRLPFF